MRLLAVAILVCALPLPAQRGRRAPTGDIVAPPLSGLVISIHGALKQLTKNVLLIQADNDRLMTIRVSRKTRYFENEREIKPTRIDLETVLTVYATEDNDLKLRAVAVKVDPSPAPNRSLR